MTNNTETIKPRGVRLKEWVVPLKAGDKLKVHSSSADLYRNLGDVVEVDIDFNNRPTVGDGLNGTDLVCSLIERKPKGISSFIRKWESEYSGRTKDKEYA